MCSHCPASKTGRKASTGAGSRSLALDCACDSGTRRMSWSRVLANGYDICGRCESRLFFRCPGEHIAYCEARGDDSPERHPVLEAAARSSVSVQASGTDNGKRWRCCDCAGFVAGESSSCKRCRSVGPHEYSEEHSTLGATGAVKARRARLRADHKRRSGHQRRPSRAPRPVPTITDDLPF